MNKKIEPDKVMPTYSGFLIMRLSEIWKAWDEGDPEFALDRACRFVLWLPDKLKEILREDLGKITEARKKAYGLSGSDFFLTHLKRNRKGREVAIILLPRFIDSIMSLLDKWGYLTEVKRKFPVGGE